MKVWKRILSAFLAATVFLAEPVLTVCAEEGEKTEEQKKQDEMSVSYALPVDTNALEGWPQGPSVFADSAIVMDINSGAILYGKRINERHYPASITKILTVLVALENGALTDPVTFSQDSVAFLENGDAHIGMRPGETITLDDALYAVLLASANEVSYAVAENLGNKIGGGYDAFIQEMNDRSAELGCTGSHWMNANGLHNDEHYTTAHDMALIGAEVFGWQEFRTVTSTLQHVIPPTNLVAEQRVFQQNHKMLYAENQYYYPYCVGGKTGFTDQAKTTLVTFADNGDMQLVSVNLRSYGTNVYTDTKAMFDYVYANFSKVPVSDDMDGDKIERYLTEDAYVVLPGGIGTDQLEKEYELTEGGQKRQATLKYTYQGQPVGQAEVILSLDYYRELTGKKEPQLKQAESAGEKQKSIPTTGIVVAGIAAVLILGILFLYKILHKKKQQRRRKRKSAGKHKKNKKSRKTGENSRREKK